MQSDCNVIWDLAPHDIGIINIFLMIYQLKLGQRVLTPQIIN